MCGFLHFCFVIALVLSLVFKLIYISMLKKYWFKLVLGLIVIIVFVGLINFDRIQRFTIVLSLFSPEKITDNFINMESIFDVNEINPADTAYPLIEDMTLKLPSAFQYKDSTIQVDDYIDYTQTQGLLVLKSDTILYESYPSDYMQNEDFISWSVSKSFVSALMGIAIEKGFVASIMDPVEKYAPVLKGSGYEGVSIKDVLQMSSGIHFDEDYHKFSSDINRLGRVFALGSSFDSYVASLDQEREPGTYHHYVSMDTQVAGMVIKEATGISLSSFMENELWKPLGAEAPSYWLKDSKGMEAAFGGLNCNLRDYGRFGLLYANDGFLNGSQILTESWVNASTTATEAHLMPGIQDASSHPFGYGYQWWIPGGNQGDFMAMGVYSQFIYVDPVNNIVIVKNSSNYHYAVEKRLTTFRHLEFFRAIRSSILKQQESEI